MTGAPGIGALRRRLQRLVPQDVPDGMGGAERSLVAGDVFWGRVEPRRRREAVAAGRATGLVTHTITVRAEAAVTGGTVLRDGDRFYRVVAVEPADPRRRYLACLAEEEAP